MLISDLQQFLRLMLPPLTALGVNAAGQKSLSGGVESLVKALEPFQGWETGELAAWLVTAQGYRETGVVPDPPAASGSNTTRSRAGAAKPPKKTTAEVVASLRELQDRRGGLDPSQVKAEVAALEVLTVPQLKEVQQAFLSVVIGKNKTELLAAIRKRINDHHASRDRVDGILAQ